MLNSCTTKKDIPLKIYSLEGQWQLVEIFSDTPADINEDGISSTDLYGQLDNCYTQNVLVLEDDPVHSFKALWVYTGSGCTDIEQGDIRVLPGMQYLPNEQTINFVHKYFVDTHHILHLDDLTLEIEGSQLLNYKDNPPLYTKAKSRFRRLAPEEEMDIVSLLKNQDLFPGLTIYGTVQAIEEIENGQVITVQLYEDNIFIATINKENLWPRSLNKVFEVSDEVVLKGEAKFDEGEQTMLVHMIY